MRLYKYPFFVCLAFIAFLIGCSSPPLPQYKAVLDTTSSGQSITNSGDLHGSPSPQPRVEDVPDTTWSGSTYTKSDDVHGSSSPQPRAEVFPLTTWSGPACSKSYDAQFIESITDHWYELLKQFDVVETGVVVLRFKQTDDGTISDIKVIKSTVGSIPNIQIYVCEKAVTDTVFQRWTPALRWTPAMRECIGRSSRIICFNFYYR
jgi:hypothetical protein